MSIFNWIACIHAEKLVDFNSNIAYIFLRFRFETETSHNDPNEEGHKAQKNEHVIEESGNRGRHKNYKLDSETNLVINIALVRRVVNYIVEPENCSVKVSSVREIRNF